MDPLRARKRRRSGQDERRCQLSRRLPQRRRQPARRVAFGHQRLRAVLAGKRDTYRAEYPCHSADMRRWFELLAKPVEIKGGRGAIVCHRNITERHDMLADIAAANRSATEYAAVAATSTDGIICFDLDGTITTWSPGAERLYGYAETEAVGRSLEIIYPQDWEIRVGEYIDEVVAQGQKSFEVVRVARDGTEMNISVSAAPIRDWTGEIIGISNIHRDITEKKQAEVHQQFILRELTHRTKNMIAVVSAIERQTANRSNSLEDFRASFGARLRGLAESNELLVASQWAAVPLADLAARPACSLHRTQPRPGQGVRPSRQPETGGGSAAGHEPARACHQRHQVRRAGPAGRQAGGQLVAAHLPRWQLAQLQVVRDRPRRCQNAGKTRLRPCGSHRVVQAVVRQRYGL